MATRIRRKRLSRADNIRLLRLMDKNKRQAKAERWSYVKWQQLIRKEMGVDVSQTTFYKFCRDAEINVGPLTPRRRAMPKVSAELLTAICLNLKQLNAEVGSPLPAAVEKFLAEVPDETSADESAESDTADPANPTAG